MSTAWRYVFIDHDESTRSRCHTCTQWMKLWRLLFEQQNHCSNNKVTVRMIILLEQQNNCSNKITVLRMNQFIVRTTKSLFEQQIHCWNNIFRTMILWFKQWFAFRTIISKASYTEFSACPFKSSIFIPCRTTMIHMGLKFVSITDIDTLPMWTHVGFHMAPQLCGAHKNCWTIILDWWMKNMLTMKVESILSLSLSLSLEARFPVECGESITGHWDSIWERHPVTMICALTTKRNMHVLSIMLKYAPIIYLGSHPYTRTKFAFFSMPTPWWDQTAILGTINFQMFMWLFIKNVF